MFDEITASSLVKVDLDGNQLTESEYSRAKAEYLRQLESAYNERDKRKNEEYVDEYVRHFLDNEPIPGIVDGAVHHGGIVFHFARCEPCMFGQHLEAGRRAQKTLAVQRAAVGSMGPCSPCSCPTRWVRKS